MAQAIITRKGGKSNSGGEAVVTFDSFIPNNPTYVFDPDGILKASIPTPLTVAKGVITAEQYKEIVGEDYN